MKTSVSAAIATLVLAASGCTDTTGSTAVQVTESFARYLMLAIHRWQVEGFESVAREYLTRLSRERQVSRRIDEQGDLIQQRIGAEKTERYDLLKALAAPSWFDPKLGGPRL